MRRKGALALCIWPLSTHTLGASYPPPISLFLPLQNLWFANPGGSNSMPSQSRSSVQRTHSLPVHSSPQAVLMFPPGQWPRQNPSALLPTPHSSTLSTHTQRENGAPRPSLLPALSTVCVLPPRPARFACMCTLVLTLLMSLLVSVTSLNTHQVPCSEGLNEEMLLCLLSPTPS